MKSLNPHQLQIFKKIDMYAQKFKTTKYHMGRRKTKL